jgi:hypothetical protein
VSELERLVDLVAEFGMERERATTIAYYLADRCSGVRLSTLHSSSRVSLRRDAFLVEQVGLGARQITAWLALVRGTRPVRRRSGEIVGGRPGFIEVAVQSETAETDQRFRRLAQRAAGCTPRAVSKAC